MSCDYSILFSRIPIKRVHMLLRSSTHALSSAPPGHACDFFTWVVCEYSAVLVLENQRALRCWIAREHCSASQHHEPANAVLSKMLIVLSTIHVWLHAILTPQDCRGRTVTVCDNSRATGTSSSASPAPSTVR